MDSRIYKPVSAAHPGETLLDYLDSFGWSQRELSLRSGITTKTISEICNGKAPISVNTSLAFELVFGRPAHFWINLQSNYDEVRIRNLDKEKSTDWKQWFEQFPVKELEKRGWLKPKNSESKSSDVFDLLNFLGVSSPKNWDAVWQAAEVSYRQTRKFKTTEHSVAAWVRAVELIAEQIETKLFNEKLLKESLEEIRGFSRLSIEEAFEKTESLLAKCGVAFVIAPALPSTGISGCTRWVNSKKAIVALSLRYKKDDQIWFTLFHELGHVLLHRKQHSFILDNADENLTDGVIDPEMQKFEEEANRFAADTLIPAGLLNKFMTFEVRSNEAIHDFSEAINIAPGVLVGRLQHEGFLSFHQGNDLKQTINWQLEGE